MKAALKYAEANPQLAGAVLLGGVIVAWIALRGAKGMGQDIGAGVVNAAVGVASGAGGAVADAANNPDINPLQPFGAWLGGRIYDWTHPLPVATGAQNSAPSLR